MLLCLPQVQQNQNKYCSKDKSLSLPLLLARKREKYVEKSDALMTIFLVSSLVISFVLRACLAKLSKDRVDFSFMIIQIILVMHFNINFHQGRSNDLLLLSKSETARSKSTLWPTFRMRLLCLIVFCCLFFYSPIVISHPFSKPCPILISKVPILSRFLVRIALIKWPEKWDRTNIQFEKKQQENIDGRCFLRSYLQRRSQSKKGRDLNYAILYMKWRKRNCQAIPLVTIGVRRWCSILPGYYSLQDRIQQKIQTLFSIIFGSQSAPRQQTAATTVSQYRITSEIGRTSKNEQKAKVLRAFIMRSERLMIAISGSIILVIKGIYLKNIFSLYSGVSCFRCLITFIIFLLSFIKFKYNHYQIYPPQNHRIQPDSIALKVHQILLNNLVFICKLFYNFPYIQNMINQKLIIVASLLILLSVNIQIPLSQGEYRCMLVYSVGDDQTVKIDIEFPFIKNWGQNDHYFVTLRNTKTGQIQTQTTQYGHFRRQLNVFQKVIYELCFEFLSPREVTEEILVDYNADTHYMLDKSSIKIPQNLLKIEHMKETYQNAMALKNLTANFLQIQQERAVRQEQEFKQTEQAQNKIMIVSIIQIALIIGVGMYQFWVLKNRLKQNQQYQLF